MSTWERLKNARRSKSDKMLGGVCGGLGAVTAIPAWIWRVIFLFCLFCFGFGLIPYIILWICMPGETRSVDETENVADVQDL